MRAVVKAKKPTPEKRAATDLVIRNLDKARVALGEAKTAQETKQVVHLARAMEVFAKQEKLSEECRKHAYSIWIEAMRQLGEQLREGPKATGSAGLGRPNLGDTKTASPKNDIPTLADHGIAPKESALAQKVAALPPEEFKLVREGTTKLNAALRTVEENRLKENLLRPIEVKLPSGARHGDFRELSKTIPDNSVQLIFTDPPYDEDSVALYGAAALVAARILKPGGSFIAYSGQKYLPEVLAVCSKHLRYWWTMACVYDGAVQIMQNLGVRCG